MRDFIIKHNLFRLTKKKKSCCLFTVHVFSHTTKVHILSFYIFHSKYTVCSIVTKEKNIFLITVKIIAIKKRENVTRILTPCSFVFGLYCTNFFRKSFVLLINLWSNTIVKTFKMVQRYANVIMLLKLHFLYPVHCRALCTCIHLMTLTMA